jgi:glycosyltransferase involved in cell wall biosynthesis
MFRGLRVAVVVPAFQEERHVARTLGGIPACADAIYLVDDASTDATSTEARATPDRRVRVLRHEQNRGVGAAIVTGYRAALADRIDLVAVMAGDDQMAPDDLEVLLAKLCDADADYAKGNRFVHPAARDMPLGRRLGGKALALLTRLATGLSIDDSQCGFTVARASCLRRIDLDDLWPRYGYPNDLLALLAAAGARVVEAPVRPVYAGEQSGIRPWHALSIAGRIGRRWWQLRRG